jgi:structural hemagglutinin/hemolysin toxin protein RtxA
METRFYLICFYVPESHCEIVKEALFSKGAGDFGNYDKACWQTLGTGQYRPLEGATPHIGTVAQLETLPEYKVEIICPKEKLTSCIQALIEAHPYEVPAYQIIPFLSSSPSSK